MIRNIKKNREKFTEEVKTEWLKALKSGKYIQTSSFLEHKGANCCLGVLGVIHPGLNNNLSSHNEKSPYEYINKCFEGLTENLICDTNDITFNYKKPDYSNVIPLIESLKTQE